MTKETLESAKALEKLIDKTIRFRKMISLDAIVKESEERCSYINLFEVDTSDDELKNLILKWCDKRMKKLTKDFENL